MRRQRDGFVQRVSQYHFCYKTLERYFEREAPKVLTFSGSDNEPVDHGSVFGLRRSNSMRNRKKLSSRKIFSSTTLETSGCSQTVNSDLPEEEMSQRKRNRTKTRKNSKSRRQQRKSICEIGHKIQSHSVTEFSRINPELSTSSS